MCEKGARASQSSVREIVIINTAIRVLTCLAIAVIGAPVDDYDQSVEHGLSYYYRALHSFCKWDGVHLIHIAEHGYEYEHVSESESVLQQ